MSDAHLCFDYLVVTSILTSWVRRRLTGLARDIEPIALRHELEVLPVAG
jgi:hypothetical protein